MADSTERVIITDETCISGGNTRKTKNPKTKVVTQKQNVEKGTNQRRTGGAPIDIDSDLLGITRPLSKDCTKKEFPFAGVVFSMKKEYPTCGQEITSQSRTTHPAFLYRDLEQSNRYPLFLNPQENVCMQFHNNLNTRLLERDNFIPKIPCLKEK